MTVQSGPYILTIGEAFIDVVITYEQPDFPVEIPGGSPANVALTLRRLDQSVALATWISLDKYGCLIDFRMHDSGMHVIGTSCGASYTSMVLAYLDESRAISYTFDLRRVPAPPITVPPTAQIIEAGSISAIIKPGTSTVLDVLTCDREHALMCFDPNVRPSIMGEPAAALASLRRPITLANIVKTFDEDIERLTDGASIGEVMDRWLSMGVSLVTVTHGKRGSLVVTSPDVRFTKTPSDVKVVDTVGAGDSFMGGMIDAVWGMDLRGTDVHATLRALLEEQVRAIIDRVSAVFDVIVSHKGANSPWAHELS